MKDFTISEVKESLKCCEEERCEDCPIGEHLQLFDCEITLLRLARQAIERYEQEYNKLSKRVMKKERQSRG